MPSYKLILMHALFAFLAAITLSCGAKNEPIADTTDNLASAAQSPINLIPSVSYLNYGQTVQLQGGNGTPPYNFYLVSGSGSVDQNSGVFTAPQDVGTSQIEVRDSLNNIATAYVITQNDVTSTTSTGANIQSCRANTVVGYEAATVLCEGGSAASNIGQSCASGNPATHQDVAGGGSAICSSKTDVVNQSILCCTQRPQGQSYTRTFSGDSVKQLLQLFCAPNEKVGFVKATCTSGSPATAVTTSPDGRAGYQLSCQSGARANLVIACTGTEL